VETRWSRWSAEGMGPRVIMTRRVEIKVANLNILKKELMEMETAHYHMVELLWNKISYFLTH
jgi:hypothetical protein